MKYHSILLSAALMLCSSQAFAGPCEQNFKTSGVPMVTAISYSTSMTFPKVQPSVALKRLSQAVAAEGFHGIKVNKALSSIDAYQETSGSGRPQTLRVVARKTGAGTRVDAVFGVQQGQMANKATVRQYLCRIISATSN